MPFPQHHLFLASTTGNEAWISAIAHADKQTVMAPPFPSTVLILGLVFVQHTHHLGVTGAACKVAFIKFISHPQT